MGKLNKVDLTLVKKLLAKLELNLDAAEAIKAEEGDKDQYIITMAEAAGLCSGIMQEAGMLVADVHAHVMSVQTAPPPSDMLSQILGSVKGPMGGGTSN